jgi:hypothetical protein
MVYEKPLHSKLAIASLISGFVSIMVLILGIVYIVMADLYSVYLFIILGGAVLFFSVSTIICGGLVSYKTKNDPNQFRNRRMARTGLILGIISVVLILGIIYIVMADLWSVYLVIILGGTVLFFCVSTIICRRLVFLYKIKNDQHQEGLAIAAECKEAIKQSGCGKASFILGCISWTCEILLIIFYIYIEYITRYQEMHILLGVVNLLILAYVLCMILITIFSVPGFILGIVGILQRRGRKQLAILGIGMNIVAIILIIYPFLFM